MKKKRRVAIFDVDGTIFRSSLLIEVVEAMIHDGVFPEKSRQGYERSYKAWLNRTGTYEDYIEAVVRVFEKNIKGVSYKDFMDVGDRIVREEQYKIYRHTRDFIKTLKKQKYFLLAISQSPKGMLEKFCKNLGFDKVYGRLYELGPQDRMTGKIIDLHLIANKANIVRRAIEKENLTLERSIGIGDTESDIPFLEMVETAICFNPNMKLYKAARRNGWKVVVERKDVIYELN